MAKDKVIEITGGIAEYNVSRNYVKYMLDQVGTGPVTVQLSSLGGDVNQALQIKKLIADRGDVTIQYFGFNASASTIVGHGAAKTQICDDSFYLIHKASVPVNPLWGSMNPDEIDQAIADLQADKKDAETVSLVIAQDYVNSRNMKMSEVMDLMKEARWLSAKEAVELGLVDELIPSSAKKSIVTNEMVAILSANGYPSIPAEDSSEEEKEENLITKIINKINSQKNKPQMTKDYSFINSVLGVEGVEVKDNMVSVTVENILKLNNELKAKTEAVQNLTTEKQTAIDNQATAENALTGLTAKIDELDPTVKAAATTEAKVAAITAKLASRPGAKVEKPHGNGSETSVEDSVEWDGIDSLPHNIAADKEYLPTKTK